LAIIYVMERDEDEIIGAQLTESLEVSPPTMIAALKRKAGDGWIATEEGAVSSPIPRIQMPYL
jgi:Mn-dependent DtxR family transcriptional regulator